MPIKIVQIAIVVFWVASVGWLAKSLLTPDHAGMIEIDPRRPVSAFFNWNESTRMSLLQGNKTIAEIAITGYADEPEIEELPGFSISGTLNATVKPAFAGTFCNLSVRFDESFEPATSQFIFRIPSQDLSIRASAEGEKQVLKAELLLGGNRLFHYDGSVEEGLDPAIEGMVKSHPLASGLLSSAEGLSQVKPKIRAYRGMHKLAGRRLPVYLLTLKVDSFDEELKIYFSESGEPLQIETGLGYEAISEVLVPINRPGFD